MEQALSAIRTLVPDFAGYADENTRRLADEQIRAVVGEALALLNERHREYFTPGPVLEMYDRLILRCEFTNQVVFKAFEYEKLGDDTRVAIAHADEALIAKAQQAESVAAETLSDYLSALERAFDARDAALTSK